MFAKIWTPRRSHYFLFRKTKKKKSFITCSSPHLSEHKAFALIKLTLMYAHVIMNMIDKYTNPIFVESFRPMIARRSDKG